MAERESETIATHLRQVVELISHRASRHVAKTGDIKEFIVTEEAGIAKGIRRVIAITGEEARQASLLATQTEAKFETIVKMDPKTKEKALKVFETVITTE